MSDLLELVLNLVLEVASVFCEGWGWRFYLPLLSSLGLFGLINWLALEGSVATRLSCPIVLVGIGSGIVWELVGDQS